MKTFIYHFLINQEFNTLYVWKDNNSVNLVQELVVALVQDKVNIDSIKFLGSHENFVILK